MERAYFVTMRVDKWPPAVWDSDPSLDDGFYATAGGSSQQYTTEYE